MTVADDRWTDEVWSLIQESALLVIQVAPAPPDDDLIWALAAIVEAGALDRTIFLLGPAPAEETTEAWRRFRAVSRLAPPDGLDEHADRLLTARADLIGDWTAVHAGRRTDWAYGFALTHLADTVTAERPGTPVA